MVKRKYRRHKQARGAGGYIRICDEAYRIKYIEAVMVEWVDRGIIA